MWKKSQKKIGNKSAENIAIFRYLFTARTNQDSVQEKQNKDKLSIESSC